MTTDFLKQHIAKFYNGDVDLYNQVHATETPEEDAHCLKYGYNPCIHWSDIMIQVKCHYDYEDLAQDWIRYILNYLPEPHTYVPHMAFLQTLSESHHTGKMSDEDFFQELFFYSREIRNLDMKRGGWVLYKTPSESDIRIYKNYLPLYQQAARDRLSKFLGYEPDLTHSMAAKSLLRQIFESDTFYHAMPYCDVDMRAATIVKYREIYFSEGEDAADASEILSLAAEEDTA